MDAKIPLAIQPFLETYLKELEPLQDRFYGIYLYGSICLGAFEEAKSDIDVIALTRGEWASSELAQLGNAHKKLVREYRLGKRLEVSYVPLAEAGKYNREIAPYPCARDGKFFPAKHGDLNAVTWWLLSHKGISLYGHGRNELKLETSWQDVLETMRYNLEGYWAGKARKSPYLFLFDYWVEFAVSTLCRILTAVEENEIIAKSPALLRWKEQLPGQFQPLVEEAWRIRHEPGAPSRYNSRLKRMRETLGFIEYARERGRKALQVP